MKTATAHLKSVSPYGQSRFHNTEKLPKELPDDHEKRTWRGRLHVNQDGNVIMPPTAFKNCIAEAAKYMNEQVPGKGKSTWTKHFLAGILVVEPLVLPVKKEEVAGEWLHLNADGKKGGGVRVMRCMPRIDAWEGDVVFHILDDQITPEIFKKMLIAAGQMIGVGYFRPRNGGFWGRFSVEGVKWAA